MNSYYYSLIVYQGYYSYPKLLEFLSDNNPNILKSSTIYNLIFTLFVTLIFNRMDDHKLDEMYEKLKNLENQSDIEDYNELKKIFKKTKSTKN